MLKIKQNNKGNSLIEIVVALAIFSLISTSLASLLIGSFNLLLRQAEITQANNLANEGVEAVMFIKDNKWNNLLYSQSTINRDSGQWELSGEGTSDRVGVFGRRINFYPVFRNDSGAIVDQGSAGATLDLYSKKAEVIIDWDVVTSGQKQATRVMYLSNWDSSFWKQNDWLGGSGQLIWSNVDMYDNDDGNIEAGSGSLSLLDISDAATTTGTTTEPTPPSGKTKKEKPPKPPRNPHSSTTPAFAMSGYLESSAFVIPIGGNLNAIEWAATSTRTSTCPECEVRVFIKTAPDAGGIPGNWSQTWSGPYGDNGDENDYFATSTGALLNTDCNDMRWIKYRVMLVGNGKETPVLEEMRINYN